MEAVSFTLNGQAVSVESTRPEKTLLDCLRERGLTGAKEGCAEGECGACTVAMVVADGDRSTYRAVNSCLLFVEAARGREIYTVESLAREGVLAPAQAAIAAAGGSQCGYCTPGFVMSLFAEQYREDRTGPCDPLALAGNLCRCTGYRPIRDAALSLGAAPAGEFRERQSRPAARLQPVAGRAFSRPGSVEDCVAELSANPAARILAGGTDLGVEANLHFKRWPKLISVEGIDELSDFAESADEIRIGAALPLAEITKRWPTAPEAWREWTSLFASPPIRNRATLGGNLATASPIGDAAPLLLALDATVEIAGMSGRRQVALASFFTGYRKTVMSAGDVLVAVRIPKPLPTLLKFYKVAKRRLDDISTVAAAMAVDMEPSGRIRRARLGYGGVAATPMRVTAAELALEGQQLSERATSGAKEAIARALTPMSDHRGSKEYRLQVAMSLVDKFLREVSR